MRAERGRAPAPPRSEAPPPDAEGATPDLPCGDLRIDAQPGDYMLDRWMRHAMLLRQRQHRRARRMAAPDLPDLLIRELPWRVPTPAVIRTLLAIPPRLALDRTGRPLSASA